jgi:putative component of toxin-antitoxin plasmid stabilization module
MSKFFLNNQSLNINDFEIFKNGIIQLMSIEKKQEHIFFRNESCYQINHFAERIFPNIYSNRDIFNLYDFFAKLSPCDVEVQDEATANNYCTSNVNGFLGIDFNGQAITEHKKIVDSDSYLNWNQFYQTNFEQLTAFLGNSKITNNFEKSYASLSPDAQESIKDEFEKAANRNLATRFYPDTKIVKDVSVSKKCTVYELRVYQPVALRVYFNEIGNTVYLASIEQKSNPDQNDDIKKAEKLLILINS